jgi:putative FmdB family regulatory protein
MPTYAFRCPEGHDFDRFYKTISGSAMEVACPECGKMGTRQMSGGAGLMFKGSGFYLTDYGKNAHRSSGSKPESAKSESGKAEGKSESGKAEGKSESGKAESPGSKAESPKPKAESPKADSAKPAPRTKPKSE